MLYRCLTGVFRSPADVRYKIYGDSIYLPDRHLVARPKGRNLAPGVERFNAAMSALRISVEWMIGKLYSTCRLLKMKDRNSLLQSNLHRRMVIGIVLTNCHTCLYGSQASMYFRCESPDLAEYTEPLFRPNVEIEV